MPVGSSIDILHNAHILLSSVICAPHIWAYKLELSLLFYRLDMEIIVRMGKNNCIQLREICVCVIVRNKKRKRKHKDCLGL